MTLAIALQTDRRRLMLALTLPSIRWGIFHLLILALSLPTIGLLVEGIAQAGLVSLLGTAAGLGLVLGLLFTEARRVKL